MWRVKSHIVNSSLKCLCATNLSRPPQPHPRRERRTNELPNPFLIPGMGLAIAVALQARCCVQKSLFPNGHFLDPKPYFLFPHGQFKSNALGALIPGNPSISSRISCSAFQLPFFAQLCIQFNFCCIVTNTARQLVELDVSYHFLCFFFIILFNLVT